MTPPADLLADDEAPPPAGAVRWMRRCLALARRGAGAVSPNPLVGAGVVKKGTCLGEGWHARYGGPHAERAALADAEARHGPEAARGATLYVNIEPCSHHGKQPPCADLLLERGIARVVVGMVDPFPQVRGRGIERLRAGGVEVAVGTCGAACRRLNEAFAHHVRPARPLVTLKIAQTLDGRVATRTGQSRWISGPASRRLVHRWRAEADGVLVGSGTARADDPALTVRHSAGARQAVEGRPPSRLVLDRTGALPSGLQLFTDAFAARTVAVVGAGRGAPPYAERLEAAGGRVLHVPEAGGHLDLGALLDRLGADGGADGGPLQSLLVEAGPGLATALVRQDLVDRLLLFVAPRLIGTGTPALADLGIDTMEAAFTFAESRWEAVGRDLLFRGYRRAA